MEPNELKERLDLKELELNSLLEITQAINSNLPEDALYKIFDFTLRANLRIRKIALYVLEEFWNCKVNYGTDIEFSEIPLPKRFSDVKEWTKIDGQVGEFKTFDFVFPVKQQIKTLAIVFVGKDDDGMGVDTTFLEAISNIIIVAIENKRLANQQLREEAFKKELEIAKNVQRFLFPDELPYGIRLKIEASYIPHQSVGGDYYDYIPINRNQFLICIADVSGKGVPAALIMSNFQASLRAMIRHTPNLTEIIEALNYQLLENAKGENFITFFGGIYDHKLKTLVYINAGHNHPVLIGTDNKVKLLDEGTTILGAFHPLPFINEGFITDLDNFLLFLYTDGLTETSNNDGEEYGPERLAEFLAENANVDLREIHKRVMNDLDTFKEDNEYLDDITLLSCKLED